MVSASGTKVSLVWSLPPGRGREHRRDFRINSSICTSAGALAARTVIPLG
jgi:hypothetical protein